MSAREAILARIRTALDRPVARPRDDSSASEPASGGGARREVDAGLFVERVRDYGAEVEEVGAREVAAAAVAACARHGVRRLAVPDDLPAEWRPPSGPSIVTEADAEAADAALTGCARAVAKTGTIVIDGGPAQGRRALSLLPDVHVCVVCERQLVAGVEEALLSLSESIPRTGRPAVLISGPSATSDIELTRVEGVHGPRRLVVLLVRE